MADRPRVYSCIESCFLNSIRAKYMQPEQNKRVWALASQLENAKKEFERSSAEIKKNSLRKLIRLTKEFNELVMAK